jgi:hypothetical protein
VTAVPTTIEELWGVCFVANTADEATRQAFRQYEPFDGKVIVVKSITGQIEGTGYREFDLTEGLPVTVRDIMLDVDWDGDNLIPEWVVRPVNPDTIVTERDGSTYRAGDIECMCYNAPGIGTEEGFAHRTAPRIYPEPAP